MMDEDIDAKITRALQDIDSNFLQAIEVASTIYKDAKLYKSNINNIHDSTTLWLQFFRGFTEVNASDISSISAARPSMSPATNNYGGDNFLNTPSLDCGIRRMNDSSVSSLPTPPATTPFYGKQQPCGKIFYKEEDNSRNTSFGTPQVAMTPGGAEITPLCNQSDQSFIEVVKRGSSIDKKLYKTNNSTDLSDFKNENETSCLDSEPPTPDAPMLSGSYSDEDGEHSRVPVSKGKTRKMPNLRTPLAAKDSNALLPASSSKKNESFNTPISAFRVTRSAAKANQTKVENTPPPPIVESLILSTPLEITKKSPAKRSAKKSSKKATPKKNQENEVSNNKNIEKKEEEDNFRLDRFPRVFQTGDGAKKITSLFRAIQSKKKSSATIIELKKMVPSTGDEMMKLLLETLASRSYIEEVINNSEISYKLKV